MESSVEKARRSIRAAAAGRSQDGVLKQPPKAGREKYLGDRSGSRDAELRPGMEPGQNLPNAPHLPFVHETVLHFAVGNERAEADLRIPSG